MKFRCLECGREYRVSDYAEEIDAQTWHVIGTRSCDRG
jgi:hypothetical protein